jgi:hypothetical protein
MVTPAFTASFDQPSGPRHNIVNLQDPTLEACEPQLLKRIDDAAKAIAAHRHTVRAATSPDDYDNIRCPAARHAVRTIADLSRTA